MGCCVTFIKRKRNRSKKKASLVRDSWLGRLRREAEPKRVTFQRWMPLNEPLTEEYPRREQSRLIHISIESLAFRIEYWLRPDESYKNVTRLWIARERSHVHENSPRFIFHRDRNKTEPSRTGNKQENSRIVHATQTTLVPLKQHFLATWNVFHPFERKHVTFEQMQLDYALNISRVTTRS